MSNLDEMLNRKRELEEQLHKMDSEIGEAMKAMRKEVLEEIRAKVKQFGFTRAEVFGGIRKRQTGKKAQPKYLDPETNKVWSGRGRRPAWFNPEREAEYIKAATERFGQPHPDAAQAPAA